MKKTAIAALMLAAIISLASCAQKDISGKISQKTGAETSTNTTTTSDNTTASTQEEPSVDLPTRGSLDSTVYENASLQLGIEFNDEWELYDDAQLAVMNGLTEEALGENFSETLKSADLLYDLYAQQDNGTSINIIFEKMGLINGLVISESDYLDASLSQVEEYFAQLNWTVEDSKKGTVTAADQEFSSLEVSVNVGNGYVYETQLYKKIGNHMAVITIASVDRDVINNIIDSFYKV